MAASSKNSICAVFSGDFGTSKSTAIWSNLCASGACDSLILIIEFFNVAKFIFIKSSFACVKIGSTLRATSFLCCSFDFRKIYHNELKAKIEITIQLFL